MLYLELFLNSRKWYNRLTNRADVDLLTFWCAFILALRLDPGVTSLLLDLLALAGLDTAMALSQRNLDTVLFTLPLTWFLLTDPPGIGPALLENTARKNGSTDLNGNPLTTFWRTIFVLHAFLDNLALFFRY